MRVVVLTTIYPNPYQPYGGAFNRQQFNALAAEHDVQIIAPIPWTREWSAGRRGQASPELAQCRRRVLDGVTLHHPRYTFTPKVLRGWYGRFYVRSVRECFREVLAVHRPEVVLGCWAYPDGWAAVRLAREAGLPVAVRVHGSDLLMLDGQPARRRRTIEALSAADAVTAGSRHLGARAVAMGASPTRVRVIYDGVDTRLFQPGSRTAARSRLGVSSAEPLILFVGRLVPVKGIDVLINGLSMLATRGTPFRCVLVGGGPLKDTLQAQIRALGLADRVGLLGERPLDQLPSWYQAADLVVLPSHSEGLPNVLREAIACGIPFVTTSVGGTPEIAHPDTLVPPGDAAALAERIGAFLGPAGPPPVCARFTPPSWKESAGSLAGVLNEIVERPRTPSEAGAGTP